MSPEANNPSVLLVSGDFVTTGGMDRANLALASYLARSDPSRQVHVVAHRVDDALRLLPNLKFHRAAKPFNSYMLGAPLLARAGIHHARQIEAAGGRVIVNGANCDWPDVNWVHYVHAAAKHLGIGSGSVLRRVKTRGHQARQLRAEAAIVPNARLVIANSRRTARDLVERVGVAEDRIRVVYYGVDASRFRPAAPEERRQIRARLGWTSNRPLVAFIGALGDRRKGFDVLFDAWRQLCSQSDWDADLVVLGAGAELARWKSRAASASLASRIHFQGFCSDVPSMLNACDALVAPTRYEAYGLGVHEAICCGLPAIVSADAGVAERYQPEIAPLLLRDPEDAAGLMMQLRAWHRDRARWAAVAQAVSIAWRKRTWDDMAAEIVSLVFEPSKQVSDSKRVGARGVVPVA